MGHPLPQAHAYTRKPSSPVITKSGQEPASFTPVRTDADLVRCSSIASPSRDFHRVVDTTYPPDYTRGHAR
jgi:hypothetical protein